LHFFQESKTLFVSHQMDSGMDKPDAKDFRFLTATKIEYVPWASTFSTYEYEDPRNSCSTLLENRGRADVLSISEREFEGVRNTAVALLRKRALEIN
jgi:hypothetical protein